MEDTGAHSILIVDDDPDVRDSLADGLELLGHEVATCALPDEIGDKMRSQPGGYEFIVLDQRFGEDTSRGVREIPGLKKRFPRSRIVVLTGYEERELCIKALSDGADRYIPKPVHAQGVGKVIRAMVDIAPFEHELLRAEDAPGGLLSGLVSNADIGVSIIDRTYHIVYMNAKQREISNKRACKGGVCWIEYNDDPGQTVSCSWCPVTLTLGDGLPHKGLTRSPVDGVEHLYEVTSQPLKNDRGELVGAIELVEDITERESLGSMHAEVLAAATFQEGLDIILRRLLAFGFDRARLYLLSTDGKYLKGAAAQPHDVPGGITSAELRIDSDPYSRETLRLTAPRIYGPGELASDGQSGQKPQGRDATEWMDVPLGVGGRCIGKISLDNGLTGRPLSLVAPSLLMEFAKTAAGAVARAKEKAELERMRQLDALLLDAEGAKERFNVIAEFCTQIVRAVSCHIRRLKEGEVVLTGKSPGFPAVARRATLPSEDPVSLSCETIRENRMVLATGERLNRLKTQILESPGRNEEARVYFENVHAAASFPLMFGGEAIGALVVDAETEDFFTPDMSEKIQKFAGRAARIMGSEEQLENIGAYLRSLGTPVMVTSLKRTVLMMNDAMRRLLDEAGSRNREGDKCYEALARGTEPCPDCQRQTVQTEGCLQTRERTYDIGQRRRTFRVTSSAVRGNDGQLLGTIEAYHEITTERILFDLAERIQNAEDEAQARAAILDALGQMGYDRCRFYRYDPDTETLVSTASRGMRHRADYFDRGKIVFFRSDVSHRNSWLAIDHATPIVLGWDESGCDDVAEPKWDKQGRFSVTVSVDAHRIEMSKTDVMEWLDLPLVAAGRTLGKITIDSKYSSRAFSGEDYTRLTAFSRFVAQALASHAARAELRAIFDAIPDQVAVLDRNTRIIYANASATEKEGLEVGGKVCEDICPIQEGDESCRRCAVRRCFETSHREASVVGAANKRRWLDMTASPLECDGSGKPNRVILVVRDQTSVMSATSLLSNRQLNVCVFGEAEAQASA